MHSPPVCLQTVESCPPSCPVLPPPPSPFTSAYKALMDAQPHQRCELISFHSISKGTSGECGLRGGYHVYTNIHPDTVAQVRRRHPHTPSMQASGRKRARRDEG
jgi:aspartate/methionine/tyrosine aminotransferase